MLTVLIFAHVPPPHHGQSFMVAQLLADLRARPQEIRTLHVDCRISDDLEDVGRFRPVKILRLLRYCLQAIRLRLRHGPMLFYYVPAPARRGALYRDWVAMAACRPFFRRRLVFHWHAVGLGKWIADMGGSLTARISRRLLGGADLSLVLAPSVAADAEFLHPRRVRALPNGIDDPCPDFEQTLLPLRTARRRDRGGVFRVLFLALCTREKGVYDALEGVFAAQETIAADTPSLRLSLTVAGQFMSPQDKDAFLAAADQLAREWRGAGPPPAVECVGFVSGAQKDRLLRESDCFCFPTYYRSEVMPVCLLEALAYGMPVVATRWRAIPDILPATGCFLVETHQPAQVAAALREATRTGDFPVLREHFLANFSQEPHCRRFLALLHEAFGDDDARPDRKSD